MYEEFYGLSAAPFQINPDPGFYFESKGHGSAYQYLRFGAFQGEGFIVVTGEIGAGKTTLLRALLEELDPARVVAAQVVSTQLGADELLSAVALAFGMRVEGLSKARLLVTLEAFLATLATSNRRALLIVDEAQNLSLESIEELRMLSNFQFGNRALLQSFLVGQPELREMLRQPRLEQLRQRILASCHLGPMDSSETRGYIEHRLRHVGWRDRPTFEPRAFDLIHQATGGVPRRINILCNRLMLSAYLDEAQRIEVDRVRRIELELRNEANTGLPAVLPHGEASAVGPLLCVVGSVQALWAVGALQQAFASREDLPPVHLLRLVGASAICDDSQALEDLRAFGVIEPGASVRMREEDPVRCLADVAQAMAAQIQLLRPGAVLVAGDGMAELASAMAAMAANLPVVRVTVGAAGARADPSARRRGELLDRAANLLFVATEDERQRLLAQGHSPEAVHLVGSVAVDAARFTMEQGLRAGGGGEGVFEREGLSRSLLTDPAGYVLVGLREPQARTSLETLVSLDLSLRESGWRLALVCPVDGERRVELGEACARAMATDVRVVGAGGHAHWLAHLRHARCLVTDDAWLQAQALAFGVPCLDLPASVSGGEASGHGESGAPKALAHLARQLTDIISSGGRRVQPPPLYDGHAAQRIAAELADWLLARQDHEYHRFLQRA